MILIIAKHPYSYHNEEEGTDYECFNCGRGLTENDANFNDDGEVFCRDCF